MAFAIETRQLSKHYGELPAVKSLQLMIPEGQFHGLLGPNGSGKTTTIHMLCTLTHPDTGTIRITGINALEHPVKVRQNIGLVFQESALDRSLSVEENLYFAGALYGLADDVIKQRVDELLQLFDLTDKRQTRVAAQAVCDEVLISREAYCINLKFCFWTNRQLVWISSTDATSGVLLKDCVSNSA